MRERHKKEVLLIVPLSVLKDDFGQKKSDQMRKPEVCARLKIGCSTLNTKVSQSSMPVINSR